MGMVSFAVLLRGDDCRCGGTTFADHVDVSSIGAPTRRPVRNRVDRADGLRRIAWPQRRSPEPAPGALDHLAFVGAGGTGLAYEPVRSVGFHVEQVEQTLDGPLD